MRILNHHNELVRKLVDLDALLDQGWKLFSKLEELHLSEHGARHPLDLL